MAGLKPSPGKSEQNENGDIIWTEAEGGFRPGMDVRVDCPGDSRHGTVCRIGDVGSERTVFIGGYRYCVAVLRHV